MTSEPVESSASCRASEVLLLRLLSGVPRDERASVTAFHTPDSEESLSFEQAAAVLERLTEAVRLSLQVVDGRGVIGWSAMNPAELAEHRFEVDLMTRKGLPAYLRRMIAADDHDLPLIRVQVESAAGAVSRVASPRAVARCFATHPRAGHHYGLSQRDATGAPPRGFVLSLRGPGDGPPITAVAEYLTLPRPLRHLLLRFRRRRPRRRGDGR